MTNLTSIFDNENAKFNFIVACFRVAMADGEICDEENEYLTYAAKEMGLSLERTSDAYVVAKNKSHILNFSTRKQSIIALMELIQLCYVENNFSTEEREEITCISKEMNIGNLAVKEIEEWVLEGIEWSKKGEKIAANL